MPNPLVIAPRESGALEASEAVKLVRLAANGVVDAVAMDAVWEKSDRLAKTGRPSKSSARPVRTVSRSDE